MPSDEHYVVGSRHPQVAGESPLVEDEPYTGISRREWEDSYVEIPDDQMVFIPFLIHIRVRCDGIYYDIRPPVPIAPRANLSISLYSSRRRMSSSGLRVHSPHTRQGIAYSGEITTGGTMVADIGRVVTLTPGIWWVGLIADRTLLNMYKSPAGNLYTRQSLDLSAPNGGAIYTGVVYGQEPSVILLGDANLTADQLGVYAHRLAFRNV